MKALVSNRYPQYAELQDRTGSKLVHHCWCLGLFIKTRAHRKRRDIGRGSLGPSIADFNQDHEGAGYCLWNHPPRSTWTRSAGVFCAGWTRCDKTDALRGAWNNSEDASNRDADRGRVPSQRNWDSYFIIVDGTCRHLEMGPRGPLHRRNLMFLMLWIFPRLQTDFKPIIPSEFYFSLLIC